MKLYLSSYYDNARNAIHPTSSVTVRFEEQALDGREVRREALANVDAYSSEARWFEESVLRTDGRWREHSSVFMDLQFDGRPDAEDFNHSCIFGMCADV